MAQQTGFQVAATGRTMYLRAQTISTSLPYTAGAYNTGSLVVSYVRNKEAAVAITLVTQTAAGTWASGGFVHVASGLYRVDVPNAAFATATDNVQVVASGVSDVIWTSSSADVTTDDFRAAGITTTAIAGAVLNAALASYNSAGTIGERLNVLSLAGITGGVWNAATSSYATSGSFGLAVVTGGGLTANEVRLAVLNSAVDSANSLSVNKVLQLLAADIAGVRSTDASLTSETLALAGSSKGISGTFGLTLASDGVTKIRNRTAVSYLNLTDAT